VRIVFSRKGFDSASGGTASPIVSGVPISLPIPTLKRSITTYEQAGLGELVARITRGRRRGQDLCHEDPMFYEGRCAFGQTGAAQSHLANNGVGVGDVFLFFGLFADEDGANRHHRIFGFLQVEEVRSLGRAPGLRDGPAGFPRRHPHTVGDWNENNTLYLGRGLTARFAHPNLRLTRPGGPVSLWAVPTWMQITRLSYHRKPERWIGDSELRVVGRGQEFVADISDLAEPRSWLNSITDAIIAN